MLETGEQGMRKCLTTVLLGAMMIMPAAQAAPLTGGFVDVVQPDQDLTEFLRTLVETAQAGIGTQSRAYAVLDGMIAESVQGFSRGLDPLEKWRKVDTSDPDRGTGVDLLTDSMVEMAELPADATEIPDYRQDFLQLLVSLVGNPDEPLGTMPEMGGAVCSPARYGFDTKAAQKFAEANDTDGGGIQMYATAVELREQPDAATPVVSELPAWTLLISDYDADGPDSWSKVATSDGTTGWMQDRDDYLRLSQQHLCFDKVDGAYKIVGFYTYGL